MLTIQKLPVKYFMGVEFFRFAGLKPPGTHEYFACLDVMRVLFDHPDFKSSTPGFYISELTNEDGRNSLRLVYHSIDPTKTQDFIKRFLEENKSSVTLFVSTESRKPQPSAPENEEYRFQSFLSTNTQVFLEVSQSFGIESLRALVFSYRCNCFPQRIPPEAVFEWTFTKHSECFRQLQSASTDKQYWSDLVHYFNGQDFGLHFLVNMSALQDPAYDPKSFKEDWVLR